MSGRLAPSMSPDTQFFWDGLKERRLLIQRCEGCEVLRHPPRPMCPTCGSLSWTTIESSGRGTVHSFVVPQHPPDPFIAAPYVVALVELEEGTRLVTNLCDVDPTGVRIGLPVEVTYQAFDGDVVLHQFRPAAAP